MIPLFRLMLMTITVVGLTVLLSENALSEDALPNDALQIYGLTLDETRWGDRFCEAKDARLPVPQAPDCVGSAQTLPRIHHVQTEAAPSPHVTVHFETSKGPNGQTLEVWYAPPSSGGQSFLIDTWWRSELDLAGTRQRIIEVYGQPTLEFTHDDIEASRDIRIFDLTLGILIFTDPILLGSEREKVADRLKMSFDSRADELVNPGSPVEELARFLGPDFRGAVVQIGESGFGHQSSVQALLVDLKRAQTVFKLGK